MIPIIINNFNRLTTTAKLADYFLDVTNTHVIIHDNASTYPPLLEWYSRTQHEVNRITSNLGQHSPWKTGLVNSCKGEWYVVTDSDLDLTDVPKDLMTKLIECHRHHPALAKVGLSLRIDDLPIGAINRQEVINWEWRYWQHKTDQGNYWAAIDTTFALYHKNQPNPCTCAEGVRLPPPYSARHIPWYMVEPDEEELYYMRHALSNVSSWGKRALDVIERLNESSPSSG